MTYTIDTLVDDIPEDLARHAHRGTSFVPEERAIQERRSYAQTLVRDFENLSKHADTDEKRAQLATEFERYRQGYRTKVVTMLSAKSRCLSTMIAGPSNFNGRRAGKASDSADKRTGELVEFRERALAAIRKVLHPEDRPIMLGDDNAAERLEDKIAKAERLQELMKASNTAIRKHAKAGPDAQIAALVALGHPEGRARRLLEPDFAGRIGFADYELTNNGANIRRMRGRLVAVERNQATPETAGRARAVRRRAGREPGPPILPRQARRHRAHAVEVVRLPMDALAHVLASVQKPRLHRDRAAGRRPMTRVSEARERVATYGVAAVTDGELIGAIIGPYDSDTNLRDLVEASPEELRTRLGARRAAVLAAALELGRRAVGERPIRGHRLASAADVWAHLRARLSHLPVEEFWVIALDVRHRVMAELMVSRGSLTGVEVHPHEVFQPLIRMSAAAVILVHNHPSGDPTPSRQDIDLTRRLRETGELTGIAVLDHVVVATDGYASLADRGWA